MPTSQFENIYMLLKSSIFIQMIAGKTKEQKKTSGGFQNILFSTVKQVT